MIRYLIFSGFPSYHIWIHLIFFVTVTVAAVFVFGVLNRRPGLEVSATIAKGGAAVSELVWFGKHKTGLPCCRICASIHIYIYIYRIIQIDRWMDGWMDR